jgi:hypothetical protein
MVEVWKLQRISQEKYRRVVTDQVPIALFRIELQGESSDVTFGIGGTALPRHC